MRYNYQIPSINVNLNDITLPGQQCTQSINVQVGAAMIECEGDASELISFISSSIKEVKDLIEWLPGAINKMKTELEGKDNE